METLPLVSIIMPVYNAQQFLDKAIESILKQDYPDFELILVDDGSIDNSGNICDEYCRKDPRIKVIHQSNQGIASARNAGIRVSKGRYITFCDNDDEFLPDFLSKNMFLMMHEHADLVKFGKKIVYVFEEKIIKEENDILQKGIFESEEIKKRFSEFDFRRYFGFVWDAIYDKHLLEKSAGNGAEIVLFDETFKTGYEDVYFNYSLIKQIKTMVTNNNIHYLHYIRTGYSTTLRYSFNRIEAIYKVLEKKAALLFQWSGLEQCPCNDHFLLQDLGEKGASVISLLSADACTLSYQDKIKVLEKLIDLDLFSIEFTESAQENARKVSLNRFLIWKLLVSKKLKLLLQLGWIKKNLIDRFSKKYGMIIK